MPKHQWIQRQWASMQECQSARVLWGATCDTVRVQEHGCKVGNREGRPCRVASRACRYAGQVCGAGTRSGPGAGLLQLPSGSLAPAQAPHSATRPDPFLPEHVCTISSVPARPTHSAFTEKQLLTTFCMRVNSLCLRCPSSGCLNTQKIPHEQCATAERTHKRFILPETLHFTFGRLCFMVL